MTTIGQPDRSVEELAKRLATLGDDAGRDYLVREACKEAAPVIRKLAATREAARTWKRRANHLLGVARECGKALHEADRTIRVLNRRVAALHQSLAEARDRDDCELQLVYADLAAAQEQIGALQLQLSAAVDALRLIAHMPPGYSTAWAMVKALQAMAEAAAAAVSIIGEGKSDNQSPTDATTINNRPEQEKPGRPVEELAKRLNSLGACAPGCEGRCDFCPDEVGQEAAALLRKLADEKIKIGRARLAERSAAAAAAYEDAARLAEGHKVKNPDNTATFAHNYACDDVAAIIRKRAK